MNNPENKYQIIKLPPAGYNQWDAFVDKSPQGTLFHKTSWARLIEEVFNRKCEIIVLEKKGNIQAGIIFWPKINFGLKSITQIPNTSYQGILIKEPESKKSSTINAQFEKQTTILINFLKQNYSIIDIPLSPEITDTRPFKWSDFKVRINYTYRFPIKDFLEMEKQFSQDLRRKLKNIHADSIDFKSSDDTDPLTTFIKDSYGEHKITPAISQSDLKKFLREAIQANLGVLFYQYLEGQPVAGIFVLYDPKNVYALFSGIARDFRQKTNSELLHSFVLRQEMFKDKLFDFLGANTQQLEQFKRSFGGKLTPYYRVSYTQNKTLELLFKVRSAWHLKKRQIKSLY